MADPNEPTEAEILAQQLAHLDAEPLKIAFMYVGPVGDLN